MAVKAKKVIIPNLEKSYREAIRKNKDVSKDWMVGNFNSLRKMGMPGILGFAKTKSDRIDIGQLAFFHYDAKYKDELPYWDFFPLSLAINYTPTGFLGLNFHYLAPRRRYALLEKLLTFVNNDRMDETTRLRATYEILRDTPKYADFRPCLHQYRWDHVRSHFAIVPPTSWHLALGLPAYNTFIQGGLGKNPGGDIWHRRIWGNTGR